MKNSFGMDYAVPGLGGLGSGYLQPSFMGFGNDDKTRDILADVMILLLENVLREAKNIPIFDEIIKCLQNGKEKECAEKLYALMMSTSSFGAPKRKRKSK